MISNNVVHHLLFDDIRNLQMVKNHDLKIFYHNVNSIKATATFALFETFLSELNVDFDVIILCETKLDKGSENFYQLKGYTSFHNIRDREGGGTVIYIKDSLQPERKFKCSQDEIEFLLIFLKTVNINICSIYRPPLNLNTSYQNFFIKYEHVLNKFKNMITFGDININILKSDSATTLQYINLINSNNFEILNKISSQMATRTTDYTDTIIDHITSDIQTHKYTLCLGDSPDSDHRFLILGIKSPQNYTSPNKTISFEQINFAKISKNLNTIIMHSNNFNDFHHAT